MIISASLGERLSIAHHIEQEAHGLPAAVCFFLSLLIRGTQSLRYQRSERQMVLYQWIDGSESVIQDFPAYSAKAVICAHRNFAMSALSFLNLAPPTSSFAISELKFNEAETLLSELRPREDHGHSESLRL